ncbi:MAG TPA: hypothetical protein PLO94_10065 [Chitinophagales bacterium]|nr:hypothetical protein [Chitinophagales bacterium]
MTPEEIEQWTYLHSKMKNEGFHYCFKNYSNFTEIQDEEFHKLRKEYLRTSEELENYIIKKYQDSKEAEMDL